MNKQNHTRLSTFASLTWYEEVIKFIFTFTAKTSELLVAAGLTVSTVNFLTDGKMMASDTGLALAWAWAQALAIDSSLGVTFYYVFTSIKDRDWIKVVCYGLLTALLAIVAGTVTDVDTFSHAIHITIANAIMQVGIDVKVLTTLRAIAVVGFVLMSRLKDISFKELYRSTSSVSSSSFQEAQQRTEVEITTEMMQKLVAEMFVQQGRRAIAEEQKPVITQVEGDMTEQQVEMTTPQSGKESQANQGELSDDPPEERDALLVRVYQELIAEEKRISGRALAARAHIRRTTCNQWLATYHPEIVNEDSE